MLCRHPRTHASPSHLPACPASTCSKRVTDHTAEAGCQPACNIDVLRVLGVCRGWRELLAAMAALEKRFGGCGRIKNGFAMADAKVAEGFHLRVMMGNFVVDFRCTYAELVARPGVADRGDVGGARRVGSGRRGGARPLAGGGRAGAHHADEKRAGTPAGALRVRGADDAGGDVRRARAHARGEETHDRRELVGR